MTTAKWARAERQATDLQAEIPELLIHHGPEI